MVDKQIINKSIVGIFVGALIIASFFLLRPILFSILGGLFAAYILHPLYKYINKYVKRDNLSTILFILVLCILVIVPLWFFIPKFAKEIFNTYLYLQKADLTGSISGIASFFFGSEIASAIAIQFNVIVARFFSFAISSFGDYFSNMADIILKFSVFIFTFYFATRDAEKVGTYLTDLSPLSKSTEKKISSEFRNITDSIVFGQILTGLIQGLCLGLGLLLLGVPNTFFLTMLAIILSIIPIIGSWLVWIPVSIFLMASGNVVGGTILFFYGLLFVSTIDNLIRPYLISKQSSLNTFVVIIGTVGGLYTFGLLGLILGPLILSYLLMLIELYRQGKLNELFKE